MVKFIHLLEAKRMFLRSLKIKNKGYRRYDGNAKEICTQIVEECWNNEDRYYQVSNGNYNEFYCRDFGISTEALIALGHKERVVSTLERAMKIYSKNNGITQIISHNGKPFEFPSFACDSLPFLLRSINISKSSYLIEKYRDFLNSEILKYYERIYDTKTGLVKKDNSISGMKDYALRVSPCYHNTMMAMLYDEIGKARLHNPFGKQDFESKIKKSFWRKTHFIDDLSGNDSVTGDANVFPFWCNIFDSKLMLRSAIRKIREENLDRPFPLKYHSKKLKEHDMIWQEFFVKNWEKDTVWQHIGMCYLDIIEKADERLYLYYLDKYRGLVEMHGNFLELFEPSGRPFKTMFFCADDGMLWSSKLLWHLERNWHKIK